MENNIFLIGDSIRFGGGQSKGYGTFVEKKLKGIAAVYQPNENCRFLLYTLRNLHEWAKSVPDCSKINIVHWNNGLWDVARYYDDEALTNIELYRNLLLRVYKRIKVIFPNAKIIFATSTTVIEELQYPECHRTNADIALYNKCAIETLKPLGVEIDDLYSVTVKFGKDNRVDYVHYDDKGCEILANEVISSLGL